MASSRKLKQPLDRGSRGSLVISANSSWNLLNFCRNLISGLQDAGYSVGAIVPADEGCKQLKSLGVDVRTVPLNLHGLSPVSDLRLAAAYWRLLREMRPSAYLGITAKPNIYGGVAAQLSGIPVIASVTGLGTAFLGSKPLEMLVSAMYRTAFLRARKVFFLNRDDYDLFTRRKLVRREVAQIIPGSGIDLDWFAKAPSPDNPAPVFLFIGRLLTDKGVCEYLEAARAAKAQIPGARFQILGPADPHPKAVRDELLKTFVDDGTVELLGSTDDVRPFIEAADCVVLPSYREGLPRVLVEASAMGRPVIASDVAGCRDVVEDGVTGLLCEVKSARSLEEAMVRFAEMPKEERAQMGSAGRQKAEREFGDEHVLRAYLSALSNVERG